MARAFGINTYFFKPKKKRPGVHSKNRNTNKKPVNTILVVNTEDKEDENNKMGIILRFV